MKMKIDRNAHDERPFVVNKLEEFLTTSEVSE